MSIGLFAEKGFHDCSFQDIANELGVAQSTVMNHFPNRRSLLLAAREFVARGNRETTDKILEKDISALEKLVEFSYQSIKWYLSQPAYAQMVLQFYYHASVDEDFYKQYKSTEKIALERVIRLLKAAVREGEYLEPESFEKEAEHFQNFIRGTVLRDFLAKSKKYKRKEYKAELRNKIFKLLEASS